MWKIDIKMTRKQKSLNDLWHKIKWSVMCNGSSKRTKERNGIGKNMSGYWSWKFSKFGKENKLQRHQQVQHKITQTRPYLDMYSQTAENQKKKQCILQRETYNSKKSWLTFH